VQHRILETLQPLTKTDKPGSFERARCGPPGAIHVHSMRRIAFWDSGVDQTCTHSGTGQVAAECANEGGDDSGEASPIARRLNAS
jgi:hypothetical protein